MRLFALTLWFVTGCTVVFPLDDSETPVALDASHIPDVDDRTGVGVVELENVTIDTDALTITPASSGELRAVSQDVGGPELAVLSGRKVNFLGTIKVVGTRPLVVLARSIDVMANLDVSADGATSGPNGISLEGKGVVGMHTGGGQSSTADSGGGGGGFGAAGASGGDTCLDDNDLVINAEAGGEGGIAFGTIDLVILQGGSVGGAGAQAASSVEVACPVASRGGGGGGAIQLTALESISIDGGIDASGGGGEGGVACELRSGGAGSGGGSGGAIFLEAPAITVVGSLVAHGGGGGGGAHASTTVFVVGKPGADGIPGTQPARGGMQTGPMGNGGGFAGGDGGIGSLPPTAGSGDCLVQAGGGGGAIGRIVLRGELVTTDGASISPVAVTITP